MPYEMSHRLCLVVTSRALVTSRRVGDIHVVQVFVKYCGSSDWFDDSSVMNSVVDKLFVECFNGVFVFVS